MKSVLTPRRSRSAEANKTYDGSLTVSGNALKMKGCVLPVVCESKT